MTPGRLLLIAAIIAGTSYVGSWFLDVSTAASVIWKGAGVAILAVYAASQARSLDGWMLAVVLAFGALGDMLLETHGLVIGALAFLAGHLTAIALYLCNRDPDLSARHLMLGLTIIPVVTATAFLLPPDRAGAGLIALYALGLAAMAAAAWISRFPRTLVAAGALMFVVSDLLIFLRTGRPDLDVFPMALAVWALYFTGQVLIALGVSRTLAARSLTNG
jgi:uncharacterized membrane protein YhhN